ESTHGDIDDALSEQYGKLVAKALDKDGRVVGYVIIASGDGFADKIELIIGLNPTLDEIKGIYVLSQKETPELGNKIVESDFRDQFRDMSVAAPVSASKKPKDNQIEAITGATISSTAVCNIINKGVIDFKKALLAEAESKCKKADNGNVEGGDSDGE
ncbi:MAG TPA: FMN-binding protein, partial [Phycisphaerae bacterium]|nr:FMN-binding protein [Phycisphaerae bacterium]